jgi:hypothetical protein
LWGEPEPRQFSMFRLFFKNWNRRFFIRSREPSNTGKKPTLETSTVWTVSLFSSSQLKIYSPKIARTTMRQHSLTASSDRRRDGTGELTETTQPTRQKEPLWLVGRMWWGWDLGGRSGDFGDQFLGSESTRRSRKLGRSFLFCRARQTGIKIYRVVLIHSLSFFFFFFPP